jgi:hypothetical protein
MNSFTTKIKRQNTISTEHKDNVFVHILGWCFVFGLPAYFAHRGGFFNWQDFFSFLPIPISFMITFYANYFYLTEQLLFKRKITEFILINIGLIIGIALMLHLWHEMEQSLMITKKFLPPVKTNYLRLHSLSAIYPHLPL